MPIDIQPYMDTNYVVMSRNADVDGNCLLYTGTYYALKGKWDIIIPQDTIQYQKTLNIVEIEPGLLKRAYKDEHESHDDYVGMLAASYFTELKQGTTDTFSKRVYNYGKTHWYSWNNLEPGKWLVKGFFARLPGFWSLVKYTSGKSLNLFDQTMASLDIFITALLNKNNWSGWNLTYNSIMVYQDKKEYFLINLACKFAKFMYNRNISTRGMAFSYENYFKSDYCGYIYPFVPFMEGKF